MTDPRPPRAADPLELERRQAKIAERLFGGAPRRAETVGRYTVLRRLGAGGMAVVYAAYDESLDRRVALKLLQRAGPEPDERRVARLQREAKSMARLSHPNVATVFEIGTHARDDGDPLTFIAIEYVDGTDLRKWLEDERAPAEILALLHRAGLGLAAAHEAGVVHRDFKPANVMVGTDGVVKVVDFGVAAWRDALSEGELPEELATPTDDASLTATGRVPGTPAYMAPEQLRGERADARADQFSFCVTAWEALTGERPFAATTVQGLVDAMQDPPSGGSDLPRHVHQALRRGLSFNPDARFVNMSALLKALSFDPARRRRRTVVAIATLGLVGAGGFGLARLDEKPLCQEGVTRVEQTWNEARRATIAAAFSETALPFADDAWQTTSDGLSSWAEDWAGMRDEACTATRVHGTQSEELLDRRMACLDRAWASFEATVEVLEDADADTVIDAPTAAVSPFPLGSCADATSLLEALPPDPERRAAVAEIDGEVSALSSRIELGRVEGATEAAEAILTRARAEAYAPTLARALRVRGAALRAGGDETAAIESLEAALVESEAAGDPRLFTDLVLDVGSLLSSAKDDHDRALALLRLADGSLRRAGDPEDLRGDWHTTRGAVLRNAGRYDEAVQAYEAGLALFAEDPAHRLRHARTRAALGILAKDLGRAEEGLEVLTEVQKVFEEELGEEHPSTCRGLNQVASVHLALRAWQEGATLLERCLSCLERIYGLDHVDITAPLGNYAGVLFTLGRLDEAEPLLQRQLAMLRAERGPGSADEAHAYDTLARLYNAKGERKKALEAVDRAIAITRDRRGPTARPLAFHHYLRAEIDLGLGDFEAAQADARTVTEVLEANGIPNHPLGPATHLLQGQVASARGDHEGTVVAYRKAVERYDAIHDGEAHIDTATALSFLGSALAGGDEMAAAREVFERAFSMLEQTPEGRNPTTEGSVRFGLAQVLWEDPPQRTRALELGREAVTIFEQIQQTATAEMIRAWVTENEAKVR